MCEIIEIVVLFPRRIRVSDTIVKSPDEKSSKIRDSGEVRCRNPGSSSRSIASFVNVGFRHGYGQLSAQVPATLGSWMPLAVQ